MKQRIFLLLQRIFDIASGPATRRLVSEFRLDTLAVQHLAPLTKQYIPWTRPALRPSAVVTLLNDIMINRRQTIVECGTGVSTVYMANLLAYRKNGHLFSMEHDQKWIETLQQMIPTEALEHVTFIHAPLTTLSSSPYGDTWYDEECVEIALQGRSIELLLVDGPTSSTENPRIRHPAYSFFKSRLAVDYAVAIDDVERTAERELFNMWMRQTELSFRIVGGMAFGISRSAYKSFL